MLNPDIVCVTETWFDAAPVANIFLESSYNIAAFSYRSTGEHGGTLNICRNTCAYVTVPTGVDFISCVFLVNFQTAVLCVYTPPIGSHYGITSQNLISAVSDNLRIYRGMKMIICGDLQQSVSSSTHIRGNILDRIFTNIVNFTLAYHSVDLSDHLSVLFDFNVFSNENNHSKNNPPCRGLQTSCFCAILPDGTAQPSDEARNREKRP